MDISLQELVDLAQASGNGADAKAAVAAKVAEAIKAGTDVTALVAEAQTQFDALDSSEESVTVGEALADVVDGITAAQAEVDAADADRAARMAELGKRIAPPAEAEAEEASETAETDGDSGESEAGQGSAESEGAGEAAADEAGQEGGQEAIAASGGSPQVVRRIVLRDLTQDKSTEPVDNTGDTRMAIVASADVPDHAMGQDLKDIHGLTKAAVSVIQSFPDDVQGAYIKKSIAQFRTSYPEELVASGVRDDMEVIEYAADHSRLEGGSLVAAGGWCSPSETLYDLAPDLSSTAGLVSLPEIQISRGGLRYTQGPDFGSVWSGIGFSQTEAQAIAGDQKTVYRVPCPAFTEERAEVIGAAIEAGILQNDAYPELTERVVGLTPTVHEHKLNLKTIAKMVAGSTAVSIEAGPSASLALLNGLELQVVDVRYQYRAEESLQLEIVLPLWAKSHYRADLAMRDGVKMEQVSDADINAAFASRGCLVHWAYDWQDAFSGVNNGWGSGAANAQTGFTNSVKALVYPAGTWVRGRGEIINLSGIYDSTNIKINDFLRLFMEEKWMLVKRQWHSRVVTIPLNVNGATGVGRVLDADGKIVVTP